MSTSITLPRQWLISHPDGWMAGTVVERLKDARAFGAYLCREHNCPDEFWRVVQYEGMGWGYDWQSKLYVKDGWRSDWPDLVRLSWSPAPLHAEH
jgi:hypothetical protein